VEVKEELMRGRILSILAYTGAALTLVVAACVPFVLMGVFSNAVARAGLHIDAAYSGGTVAGVVDRGAYKILVYQPVEPRLLERIQPFVQIVFAPADALPSHVRDEVDLDGDGRPDVFVSFDLPADPNTPLRGDVTALNSKYISLTGVGGESFSRMVVRTGNQVVVRVPMNK
jgi:hypothetical protein